VILDVAVVVEQVVGHERVPARHDLAERGDDRSGSAVQLEDLALELVDALDRVLGVLLEHLELDFADVVREPFDDRRVVVDDPVGDRVPDRGGPAAHELRAVLEPATGGLKAAALSVAHDNDVVGSDEHLDLAELDRLALLDVASRLVHDEHHVVVDLELGSLVGFDRVLHRELVQVELTPHGVELLLGGLMEPDPHEGVLGVARGGQLVQRQLPGPAPPVLVQRAVHDHGPIVSPR
jgi:hypothetical protein